MYSKNFGKQLNYIQKMNLWVDIRVNEMMITFGVTALDRSEVSKKMIGEYYKMFRLVAKKMDKLHFFYDWVPTDEEVVRWENSGMSYNDSDTDNEL